MSKKKVNLKKKAIIYSFLTFKVFTHILTIFLGIVLVLSITLIIFNRLPIAGYSIFVIESESMLPTYEIGHMIIIKKEKYYSIGDVITFYPHGKDDKTYTHRIEKIIQKDTERKYITKGDNNPVADNFNIFHDDIVGRVVFDIPQVGKIIFFLKSIIGIILFIIVPSTIIFTLNIQDLYKGFENMYKKSIRSNKVYWMKLIGKKVTE